MTEMTASRSIGRGPDKALILPGLFGACGSLQGMLASTDQHLFQYATMDYRRACKTYAGQPRNQAHARQPGLGGKTRESSC